jgi:NADH-quinone oxidoreductase subunit L
MGAAVVIGLAGIAVAWSLYGRGPSRRVAQLTAVGPGAWVLRAVQNKFWVDEAYDTIVVRPFRWLGHAVFVAIDRFIIDLVIVDGSAFVVDVLGRIARWFQNGQVQRYLVGLVIGGALVLFFATRQDIDFAWEPAGENAVKLTADIGEGPAATRAELAWDFDGDGQTDSAASEVTRTYPRPGTYPVTLRVRSGPFGRSVTVTRDVVVGSAGERGSR